MYFTWLSKLLIELLSSFFVVAFFFFCWNLLLFINFYLWGKKTVMEGLSNNFISVWIHKILRVFLLLLTCLFLCKGTHPLKKEKKEHQVIQFYMVLNMFSQDKMKVGNQSIYLMAESCQRKPNRRWRCWKWETQDLRLDHYHFIFSSFHHNALELKTLQLAPFESIVTITMY